MAHTESAKKNYRKMLSARAQRRRVVALQVRHEEGARGGRGEGRREAQKLLAEAMKSIDKAGEDGRDPQEHGVEQEVPPAAQHQPPAAEAGLRPGRTAPHAE
jgi:hypothetical protein